MAGAETYAGAVHPAGPHDAASLNAAPPGWPQPPKPRRNGPVIALVVLLALLVVGGLGGTAWLLLNKKKPGPAAQPLPSATVVPTTGNIAEPAPSEDARFVAKDQCIHNEGTADAPQMRIVKCTTGTYQVLRRIDGRTTGEADAEQKCAKVTNYTKWYFYDSELDSLDFVLCLRER
jgi:hypothetical protein